MANPNRGEVAVGGDGESWTLRFTFNALCELEDATGRTATAVVSSEASRDLRAAVWAGLRHSRPDLTMEDAGRVIDVIGITEAGAAVAKALALAFPADSTTAGKKRPQRAAALNR